MSSHSRPSIDYVVAIASSSPAVRSSLRASLIVAAIAVTQSMRSKRVVHRCYRMEAAQIKNLKGRHRGYNFGNTCIMNHDALGTSILASVIISKLDPEFGMWLT